MLLLIERHVLRSLRTSVSNSPVSNVDVSNRCSPYGDAKSSHEQILRIFGQETRDQVFPEGVCCEGGIGSLAHAQTV